MEETDLNILKLLMYPTCIKILDLLNEEFLQRGKVRKFIDKYDFSKGSFYRGTSILEKYGLIEVNRHESGIAYIYRITKKGEKVLELLNNLSSLLKTSEECT
jgi:DNA-binding PadR family transcriptional regulator